MDKHIFQERGKIQNIIQEKGEIPNTQYAQAYSFQTKPTYNLYIIKLRPTLYTYVRVDSPILTKQAGYKQ